MLLPSLRRNALPALAIAIGMLVSVAWSISLLAKTQMTCRLENGAFAASVRSVIEDHDLNIVNNVYPEQRWLATRTYNSPDIRENGSVALWLPFFYYGRLLPALDLSPRIWGDPVNHEDVAMALATLFLTLLGLTLSLGTLRELVGNKNIRVALIAMVFGTPFFWYLFFEPYGTDLNSSFVLDASIFLYALLLRDRSLNARWWFLLGAFLAYGAGVKAYGFFYLAITIQVALRKDWRHLSWMLAGELLILSCLAVNQYLKFGTLQFGKQYELLRSFVPMFKSISSSVPLNTLVGPNGIFVVSPIYLFSLVGAVLWLRQNWKAKRRELPLSIPFALLAVALAISIVTSFMPFASLIGPARRFMAQQLVFLLMFQFLLTQQERAGLRRYRVILGATAIAVIWNIAMVVRYVANEDVWGDSYLISGWWKWKPRFAYVGESLGKALDAYPHVLLQLLTWFPAMLACAFLLLFLWRRIFGSAGRARMVRSIAPFMGVPVVLFVLITLMNVTFNQRNVRKLQAEGFFDQTVVGDGMMLFTYDEAASIIPMLKHYARVHHDPVLRHDLDLAISRLLNEAAEGVLVDPIGFREECAQGRMRPSFFETNRP